MDFKISQLKHVCLHWKGNTVVVCRAEGCWFFWRYVKREECRDFVWGFSLISSVLRVLHPLRLSESGGKLTMCGMAGFTMHGPLLYITDSPG